MSQTGGSSSSHSVEFRVMRLCRPSFNVDPPLRIDPDDLFVGEDHFDVPSAPSAADLVCIKHDGPTEVSYYFKPKSTGVVGEDGLQLQQSHFRERLLEGTTLQLPHNYSDFVLGKKNSSGKSGESYDSWESSATFTDITYWNHDCVPSQNDDFFRAFHWITVAEAIYATVRSGSIAIAASTLDSLLDLMSGGILWYTHIAMKNINIYQYPIGKMRVQPVGIIVFAAIMATLGFQVLVTAVEQLIENSPSEMMTGEQLIWWYSIMIFATVVKLILWLYCRSSGNQIIHTYADDHHFDVVTNVVGLVAAILGDKFYWWIDPVGAILLAIYTITNWSRTVMENAVSLVGQSGSPEFFQKLTYLVIRHPGIKHVDTVCAYTFGVLYFVEVDIEQPEELPLKESHAIGRLYR